MKKRSGFRIFITDKEMTRDRYVQSVFLCLLITLKSSPFIQRHLFSNPFVHFPLINIRQPVTLWSVLSND
jgi:hypothetical protein